VPAEGPKKPAAVVEALSVAAEELSEVAEELATVADELSDVVEPPSPEKREGEKEGGRRRRRRRRSREPFLPAPGAEPAASEEVEMTETTADLAIEEEGVAGGPESEPAPPAQRRPRGRRRRGRRERGDRPEEVRQVIDGSPADAVGPAGVADTADLDDGELLGDEDHEEGEGKSDQVGFRNIPTWPEAVGIIVAKNLESRAKNPGGDQRSRGGQRGRGGRNDRRSSNRRG
jgi:ribonuclease E